MRNKNQSNLLQKSWKNGIKEKEWSKEIYSEGRYNSLGLFVSVYSQVREVIKTSPKNILEIGIGGGATSVFLKNLGYNLTTCDFNKNLNPDFVADIKKLPFRNNSFDTVLACEILEHIPYTEVPLALKELNRITRKRTIVSVPRAHLSCGFLVRLDIPFFSKLIKGSFGIPYSFFTSRGEHESHPGHYWAIGRRGYSKKRFKNLLKNYFKIEDCFIEDLNSTHIFFILEPLRK